MNNGDFVIIMTKWVYVVIPEHLCQNVMRKWKILKLSMENENGK